MNPPCARCYKPVYPVEKLSILDKFWHKGCFRCTSCNSSLTLKTFKGFNKQPYCPAHYPKPEHSTIADDPESVRLRQQQQIVSNVEYHKEFQEKIKGQYTPVADDPESMRIKKNTEIQSQASYRTDPSAFNYTPVADDPETMRLKKNTEIQSQARYRGVASGDSNASAFSEQENVANNAFMPKFGNNNSNPGSNPNLTNPNQFRPNVAATNGNAGTPYTSTNSNQRASVMNALDAQTKQQVLMQEQQRRMQIEQQQRQIEEQQRQDAEQRRKEELELQKQQNFERQQNEIMEKQRIERLEQEKRRRAEEEDRKRQIAEQERMRQLQEAENRRRIEEEQRRQAVEREEQLRIEAEQKLRISDSNSHDKDSYNQKVMPNNHSESSSPVYRAEYDYIPDPNDPEAADELMFEEGDIIVNLVRIDEGWSTGTNQRTGLNGMLPSNYIIRIK
ncbi:uncharacterized protein LOC142336442 [Convolutriloba macropyga]|uniref:uncharacterized protein LOC142336442 n=1 Tax=Convolutriloba macropyga TaxID=536237 RepID=UPI003F51FF89